MESRIAQITHFARTFRSILSLPTFTPMQLFDAVHYASDKVGKQNKLLSELHFKLCKTASKNESFKEWEAVLLRRMTDKWKRSFTYNLLKENEYEELCMEDKLDILIALCHWKLDDVALNEYCTEHMEEQEMMNPVPIGNDDFGRSYWYFNEECCLYRTTLQRRVERRAKEYAVMYSCPTYVRLHVEYENVDLPTCPEMVTECEVRQVLEEMTSYIIHEHLKECEDEEMDVKSEESSEEEEETSSLSTTPRRNKSRRQEESEEEAVVIKRQRVSRGRSRGMKEGSSSDEEDDNEEEEVIVSRNRSSRGQPPRKKIKSSSDEQDESVEEEDSVVESVEEIESEEEEKGASSVGTDTEYATCASCHIAFDVSVLDPPLDDVPDDWKCMECLVKDARGWPRRSRRASVPPPVINIKREAVTKKATPLKKSRKSKRSHPKKSSLASAPIRRSRRKSVKIVKSPIKPKKKFILQENLEDAEERLENYMMFKKQHERNCDNNFDEFMYLVALEEPRWEVVSSTAYEFRLVMESLEGGSSVQDELRWKLEGILGQVEFKMKAGEKKRQQQYMYEVLPRRQSSRIALESIKAIAGEETASTYPAESGYAPERNSTQASVQEETSVKKDQGRAERAYRRWGTGGDSDEGDKYEEDDNEEEEEEEEEIPLPVKVVAPVVVLPPADRPLKTDVDLGAWIDWNLVDENQNKLSTVCRIIVDHLLRDPKAPLFSRPVNPELDGCVDYLKFIKRPMDLGTVRTRVVTGYYQMWQIFIQDMNLIWFNCCRYNSPIALITQYALDLRDVFATMCHQSEKRGAAEYVDALSSCSSESDSDDASSVVSSAIEKKEDKKVETPKDAVVVQTNEVVVAHTNDVVVVQTNGTGFQSMADKARLLLPQVQAPHTNITTTQEKAYPARMSPAAPVLSTKLMQMKSQSALATSRVASSSSSSSSEMSTSSSEDDDEDDM